MFLSSADKLLATLAKLLVVQDINISASSTKIIRLDLIQTFHIFFSFLSINIASYKCGVNLPQVLM